MSVFIHWRKMKESEIMFLFLSHNNLLHCTLTFHFSQTTRKWCLISLEIFMLAVLLTESYSAATWTLWISYSNSMSALTNTPQRLKQNTSECSYMQNANIFQSATVPCYIAASLVIFIWILHLRFLPLSVCVIVSNAGLDLSLHSNRGRLPPPAARFWGLPA